jgi:hypothetical protein
MCFLIDAQISLRGIPFDARTFILRNAPGSPSGEPLNVVFAGVAAAIPITVVGPECSFSSSLCSLPPPPKNALQPQRNEKTCKDGVEPC